MNIQRMELRDYILKGLRKGYRRLARPSFPKPPCVMDRREANDLMRERLTSGEPCMISRLGTGEIGIVTNYLAVHDRRPFLERCRQYIVNDAGLPWWDKLFFKSMRLNAGIFPETVGTLERFAERYLRDIPEIDLLGSFNYTERWLPLKADAPRVHLECLYPFWVENPWTLALKGRKVLVVHPFAETIRAQYARRELLFGNPGVLPEYELKTLRAVQSNAGNEVPFRDWFEALKWMEDEMARADFDVCILGCGAYGLPLAAAAKRMGKQAVHLGGGSQLLFGIKGKRWDNDRYHWKDAPQLYTNYSSLYNEHWVRPSAEETPPSARKVEGACYW